MHDRSAAPRTLNSRTFIIASLLACVWVSTEASAQQYTLFESGQVRPLALSPSGDLLFAVNTPDHTLEVFQVNSSGLSRRASIPVGMEPVAVAARSDTEVWVVNHLSDSVSVVQLSSSGHVGVVTRTLLVGDEPRDIVFAGPGKTRAFITTAHRGQNAPYDPQLTTPGIGRADVWVFDATALGSSVGGDPLTILTLFSDTPRALAVTPDGTRVYAAAFHSGNRTTVLHDLQIPDGGESAGGVPGPNANVQGVQAPEVGLIVKYNGSHWVDVLNRTWDSALRFSLPDKDVFVIDATATPPAQLSGSAGFYSGVGTILFNMAVNPVNGKVYVSNTEARNDLRFEGPGTFAGNTLRGHLHESRITVLSSSGVAPRHLNKHINYAVCCAAVPNTESEKSLAQPLGMAVTSDGATLYVAAYGSSKLGVYSTAALENDTFVPSTANQIELTGGGPTGIVLDEARGRLYTLTRFDNGVSVVNLSTQTETAHHLMHNPEPPSVVAGRRFLYDARYSSSHGDSSCGSCHIFGDWDSLAWDLGNPDGTVMTNPGPIAPPVVSGFGTDPTFGQNSNIHPMKGPLTTQSLRGMANHGPMHWRGDRSAGNDEPTAQPDDGSFDEAAAFAKFNPAFMDLLGRSAQLTHAEMEQFADFVLQITYPPNPIRNLDNTLTPTQQAGRDFYFAQTVTPQGTCETCHKLDPNANPSAGQFKGFFGTDGRSSFDPVPQFFKIPQLRNMYQKVGMFGAGYDFFTVPADSFLGDQVRGFGFGHNGAIPDMFRFNSSFDQNAANPVGLANTPANVTNKRNVEQFMFVYENNLAPIVGQQVTLTASNLLVMAPRLNLLITRANAGECDLVVRGRLNSHDVGFLYVGGQQYKRDEVALPNISDSNLRASIVTFDALTFTCFPPSTGTRNGIDHDLDGHLNGDERTAGTDLADPNSHP
ncbi:YncE family protein [Hyalangium minutum]|nr:beta-propeller fold lactonase family protein [Hyalangium minutum]